MSRPWNFIYEQVGTIRWLIRRLISLNIFHINNCALANLHTHVLISSESKYPSPGLGDTPVMARGYPVLGVFPGQDWGSPPPLERTWNERVGYPQSQKGPGTRVWGMDWEPNWSTPPPPTGCEQTENITLPHPSDVGGSNVLVRETDQVPKL